MAIDSSLVGQAAAEVMDRLDDRFGDQGSIAQDGEIVSAALVVTVKYNDGTRTSYDYTFTPSAAPHEALGILHVVLNDITNRPPS